MRDVVPEPNSPASFLAKKHQDDHLNPTATVTMVLRSKNYPSLDGPQLAPEANFKKTPTRLSPEKFLRSSCDLRKTNTTCLLCGSLRGCAGCPGGNAGSIIKYLIIIYIARLLPGAALCKYDLGSRRLGLDVRRGSFVSRGHLSSLIRSPPFNPVLWR